MSLANLGKAPENMNPLGQAAPTEPKSRLALACEERNANRTLHPVNVNGILGVDMKAAIRVPTKGEQDRALIAAWNYAAELARSADPDAQAAVRSDADILQDAKAAALVYAAFRSVDEGAPPGMHPAFPSPRWVYDKLVPDQIAACAHLVNEAKALERGGPGSLQHEAIEAVIEAIYEDPEQAATVLATYNRESLSALAVALVMRVVAARGAAELSPPPAPAPPAH